MTRTGFFLLLALTLGAAMAPVQAQVVPPMGTSLAPEKFAAKEKAVEQRAQKRRACKNKAKLAGFSVATRGKFMRDCMAAK